MRTIKFEHKLNRNWVEANKFIEQWHRHTKKQFPHLLTFTFNDGLIDEDKMKTINWVIDLLYQAFIIKNDVDKMIIDIDKRQKDFLVVNVW